MECFIAQGSSKMHNALWSDNDMQAFQGVMSVDINVRRLSQRATAGFCSKIIILLIVTVVFIKKEENCLLAMEWKSEAAEMQYW